MNYAQLAPCAAALPPQLSAALFNTLSLYISPPQVKYEGRKLYLTCVCMSCLDGTSSSRVISCR